MGQRVVFEFLQPAGGPSGAWSRLQSLLTQTGGYLVKEPSGDPPFLLIAVLTDTAAADSFLAQIKQIQGVGRAEIETIRRIL